MGTACGSTAAPYRAPHATLEYFFYPTYISDSSGTSHILHLHSEVAGLQHGVGAVAHEVVPQPVERGVVWVAHGPASGTACYLRASPFS